MRRNRVMTLLTAILTLITAVTILGVGWTLANPTIADPGPIAIEQVVRSFYTAVNETIQTGDTSALKIIVAEHIVVHGSVATFAPDRYGLTHYFASLHAITPNLELDVAGVASTGNRAVVDVRIHSALGMFLGSRLAATMSSGIVDAFRISNHQILEYWNGTANPLLLEPLAQSPAVIISGVRNFAVERLTIPPGSSFVADGGDEYRWLYGEVGKVFVRTSRMRHGPMRSPTAWPETVLAETQIAAKEFLGLPTWSRTEIENLGAAPASLLVFEVGTPASHSAIQIPAYAQGTIEGRPESPVWWTGVNLATTSEAVVATLTDRIQTTIPAGRSMIIVGQATLAQGALLSIPYTAGPCLMVATEGLVDLVSNDVHPLKYRGLKDHIDAGPLGTGDAALLPLGSHAVLSNPQEMPAIVTIFAVLPEQVLGAGSPPVTGIRMGVGSPGFPEGTPSATPTTYETSGWFTLPDR